MVGVGEVVSVGIERLEAGFWGFADGSEEGVFEVFMHVGRGYICDGIF